MSVDNSNICMLAGIKALTPKGNWDAFRIKITDMLRNNSLIDYIEGKIPKPPPVSTQNSGEAESDYVIHIATETKAVTDCAKANFCALYSIRFHISNEFLVMLSEVDTSKELWDTLISHFRPHGAMAPVLLKRKLYALRNSDGEDLQTHVNEIRHLTRELRDIPPSGQRHLFHIPYVTSHLLRFIHIHVDRS